MAHHEAGVEDLLRSEEAAEIVEAIRRALADPRRTRR